MRVINVRKEIGINVKLAMNGKNVTSNVLWGLSLVQTRPPRIHRLVPPQRRLRRRRRWGRHCLRTPLGPSDDGALSASSLVFARGESSASKRHGSVVKTLSSQYVKDGFGSIIKLQPPTTTTTCRIYENYTGNLSGKLTVLLPSVVAVAVAVAVAVVVAGVDM